MAARLISSMALSISSMACCFFSVHVMSRSQVLQMSAGVAQIGERVQICRMPSRFVGEGQGRAKSYNEHKYGAMSCSFHGLLEGLSAEMNFLDVNPDLQVLTR